MPQGLTFHWFSHIHLIVDHRQNFYASRLNLSLVFPLWPFPIFHSRQKENAKKKKELMITHSLFPVPIVSTRFSLPFFGFLFPGLSNSCALSAFFVFLYEGFKIRLVVSDCVFMYFVCTSALSLKLTYPQDLAFVHYLLIIKTSFFYARCQVNHSDVYVMGWMLCLSPI